MRSEPHYNYYRSSQEEFARARAARYAAPLGRERLRPKLTNPDYLVLQARRKLFLSCIEELDDRAHILDVGGRIQPYRPLVASKAQRYVAIDPQVTGLVDVVGIGEQLPFRDESFDFAICTQVLSYVTDPDRVVAEIHRVLKPGKLLFLTAPSLSPRHHDERWRFFADGFRYLLRRFADVQVTYEVHSVAAMCRTIATQVDDHIHNWRVRLLVGSALILPLNVLGQAFEYREIGGTSIPSSVAAIARR